eukprot:m.436572 g.436572  ORF g.436572 m.436572 type:complete len:350 (+) comp56775_c0_seq1:183-1232(+)
MKHESNPDRRALFVIFVVIITPCSCSGSFRGLCTGLPRLFLGARHMHAALFRHVRNLVEERHDTATADHVAANRFVWTGKQFEPGLTDALELALDKLRNVVVVKHKRQLVHDEGQCKQRVILELDVLDLGQCFQLLLDFVHNRIARGRVGEHQIVILTLRKHGLAHTICDRISPLGQDDVSQLVNLVGCEGFDGCISLCLCLLLSLLCICASANNVILVIVVIIVFTVALLCADDETGASRVLQFLCSTQRSEVSLSNRFIVCFGCEDGQQQLNGNSSHTRARFARFLRVSWCFRCFRCLLRSLCQKFRVEHPRRRNPSRACVASHDKLLGGLLGGLLWRHCCLFCTAK